MDLNSALLEGEVFSVIADEGKKSYMLNIKSNWKDLRTQEVHSDDYQIDVTDAKRYPAHDFHPGQHIRVVGRLRRVGNKGVVILAESIETRAVR